MSALSVAEERYQEWIEKVQTELYRLGLPLELDEIEAISGDLAEYAGPMQAALYIQENLS